MRIKMKRFLGILLSFALVLVMMSGLGVTANAVDSPYANLKNTTNVVHFDGEDWYLIDYADDGSTVTLLAKECIGASKYSDNDYVEYDQSKVKDVVDNYYNGFSAAAKTAINGQKMFLLTVEQADRIRRANHNVLKCSPASGAADAWWLCEPGLHPGAVAFVYSDYGDVDDIGAPGSITFGVRPALKLNLSSVTFSSNTFTVTGGTDPAAATSVDIPVRVEGTPDGSTGHIELDQQIDVNDPNTFIDIMTGVGGFCIYLVPTDQAAAPDNITGSYEFVYGGTTYRGDFSATKKYDSNYGFYYVVLGGLGADNNSSSSGHTHHICEDGHKFAYCVMQAPTTEVDGFAEWRCTQCGIYDWNDHDNADARETVTLSAYPVFNDTLENNIKAAEAGATVSIETKRWVSVRRSVLEALAEKPGVTLSIGFAKDGTDYVLTIPGGDPALAGILATEDRFFNFMTLGNTYGLTAVEK